MSLGLLFPGQGTQHPAMLPWLDRDGAAPESMALLQSALGADWRTRLADTEWATRNDIAQCLLTGIGLAAWEQLQPLLPAPAVVAGYSVGELAAFCVAGVFDREAAMSLARQRAHVMSQCVEGLDTGLLSVTTAAPGLIDGLCSTHGLAVAIRLGADRAILGGLRDALRAAEQDALTAGATCTRLAVSIASHTPWLAAGVPRLAAAIDAVPFQRPATALVCNFTGTALRSAADLRHALAAQIAHTVPWDRCMDTLAERGVRCVLEMGPGTTLSRMWSARHPGVPARSIDEFQSPGAVAAWVQATLEVR